MPEVSIIEQFYSHPAYIRAMTMQLRRYNPCEYDYVLFSYHGLPLRHLKKIHPETDPSDCNCTEKMPPDGEICYKATCFETSRILAGSLDLEPGKWGTSFQSRLTRNWTDPFTDDVLKELARSGKKKILVAAPSFVADCLETLIEVREVYREVFLSAGGTIFTFAESLNSSSEWAEAVLEIAGYKPGPGGIS
jgi:ferrochelatase